MSIQLNFIAVFAPGLVQGSLPKDAGPEPSQVSGKTI